jgi:hypothetical protein
MLARQFAHSRMTTATRRRIAALALARTNRYGLRTIATPGLVAAAPDEQASYREASIARGDLLSSAAKRDILPVGNGDPETRLLRPKPESPGQLSRYARHHSGSGFPRARSFRL